MNARISIVSASAGSGKTTELTRRLVEILDGNPAVTPETVIATTFTKRAAAELEERVTRALYEAGRPDLAADMADARIGTVHAVAGGLLDDYAFELGLVPGLEVIPEEDQEQLFAESLGQTLSEEELRRLSTLARKLGYETGDTYGTDWRREIQRIAEKARSNGIPPAELAAQAERSATELTAWLDPPTRSGAELQADVYEEIRRLLSQGLDEGDTTNASRQALNRVQRAAGSFAPGNEPPWAEWIALAGLKPGAASRDQFEALKTAAGAYTEHPGLAEDLREMITLSFAVAARLLVSYQEYKRSRGLVDFADQERMLLDALSNPAVAGAISRRFTTLFVDEFQDTNPMQLAIFLKLAELVDTVVWVGDPKQSIYAFRDTDPQLMQAALERIGRPEAILSTSYRSRPELVAFTNSLFRRAFAGVHSPEEVELTAARADESPDMGPALRVQKLIPEGRANKAQQAVGIAQAILGFLREAPLVYDRRQGERRRLEPGDIAVLARKQVDVRAIADALFSVGLKAAAERDGLTRTPEGALFRAAIRFVATPEDTLAEGELRLLLAEAPDPAAVVRERMQAREDGREWLSDLPVLDELRRLRESAPGRSIGEIADAVIATVDLHRQTLRFGEAAARRSNIEKLRELVLRYEEWCRRFHRSPNAGGFVIWLDELARQGDDRQGAGRGADAVNVLTYHGAKGLEWPVVVPTDLESAPTLRLTGLSVEQEGEVDLSRPLAGRRLRYWPHTGSRKADNELLRRLRDAPVADASARRARDEERRLLYVGLTRPRDYLLLPLLRSGGKSNPGYRPRWITEGLEVPVTVPDADGPTQLTIGDEELSALSATLLLGAEAGGAASPAPGGVSSAGAADDGEIRWLSAARGPRDYAAYLITPSAADDETEAGGGGRAGDGTAPAGPPALEVAETLEYAAPISRPAGADPRLLGDAFHSLYCRYIRAGADPAVLGNAEISRIFAGYQVDDVLPPAEIRSRTETPIALLQERHPTGTLLAELPLRMVSGERLMSGLADVLLLAETGAVLEAVIMDHKVVHAAPEQLPELAGRYAEQLGWYHRAVTAALEAQGPGADTGPGGAPAVQVSMYLNFPLQGRVLRVAAGLV